jgi:hypothetical protein
MGDAAARACGHTQKVAANAFRALIRNTKP